MIQYIPVYCTVCEIVRPASTVLRWVLLWSHAAPGASICTCECSIPRPRGAGNGVHSPHQAHTLLCPHRSHTTPHRLLSGRGADFDRHHHRHLAFHGISAMRLAPFTDAAACHHTNRSILPRALPSSSTCAYRCEGETHTRSIAASGPRPIASSFSAPTPPQRRGPSFHGKRDTRARGVLGMYKREGPVSVELYEGMLMLQVWGCVGAGCHASRHLQPLVHGRGGARLA